MTAGALAYSPATRIEIMQDPQVDVFQENELQLPAPSLSPYKS